MRLVAVIEKGALRSPLLLRPRMLCLRAIVCFFALALLLSASGPGFRTARQFNEHYAKHGSEFGRISPQEYLALAQTLRDSPVGGPILEARTSDGIISRFDRRNSYFGAFNPDRTIRTFFIPNDGERYFRRQARKRDAQ